MSAKVSFFNFFDGSIMFSINVHYLLTNGTPPLSVYSVLMLVGLSLIGWLKIGTLT
jgi:hypothetical protein